MSLGFLCFFFFWGGGAGGLEFSGFGFRLLGFRVWVLGFRVSGFWVWSLEFLGFYYAP